MMLDLLLHCSLGVCDDSELYDHWGVNGHCVGCATSMETHTHQGTAVCATDKDRHWIDTAFCKYNECLQAASDGDNIAGGEDYVKNRCTYLSCQEKEIYL